MKKTVFLMVAAVALLFGYNKAQAQIEIPQLPSELQEQVDEYIQTLLENPADESVMKAIDKNKLLKKDKAALVAIGYKFLEHNLFGNALGLAKKVYEMDATYLPAIYLEGDAWFKMGNSNAYGMAATKYEEAKQVTPESLDPYLKLVGVYRYINPEYAIELMEEIKQKKTDDPKINQVLGTLYYQLDDTLSAHKYYNMYFDKFPDGQGDATVQREYVIIKFMAKDYDGALKQSQKFLATNPKDPVLNRIIFLSNVNLLANTDEFEEAKFNAAKEATKAAHDKFIGQYPDSVYQEIDYRYLGQYMTIIGEDKSAAEAYAKAAEKSPEDPAAQLNLSKAYEKTKEYDKAIPAYKKFMELAKKEDDTNELFKLGRVYYNAANAMQQDSLKRIAYIKEGDAIYAKVDDEMVKSGEPSYLGIFWRSRINQLVDRKHPNATAADYMKETIKRLQDEKFKGEDYDPHRAQAYSYVAWFAMEQDDFETAEANAKEALKYEEDNPLASNVLQYVELMNSIKK
ncbi:MAG: tetratricopeptide repeat protein [Prevotellaceae bacterium]|nr:tetratricopeptide repeat protein [Prevotellaceae bacterium]